MVRVTVSFAGNLQDLIPAGRRGKKSEVTFRGRRAIKDLIESFRIPHTEVGSLQVNGNAVDFTYILQDGDRVDVQPALITVRGAGKEPRFLCDVHLWKLARRLRLLGFDVDFDENRSDDRLADIAQDEGKILLSRDRGLLIRKKVARGILIRSTDTEKQVAEVLSRLDLKSKCKPFSRCLLCNGLLTQVSDNDETFADIKKKIPPRVLAWCRDYHVCRSCGHIYWQGSHYKKLVAMVKRYLT